MTDPDPPQRGVTLLAEDGSSLGTAVLSPPRRAGEIVLASVSCRGALLGYYFARGKRRVSIDVGELRLPGRLSTAWLYGERVWRIELTTVANGQNHAAG